MTWMLPAGPMVVTTAGVEAGYIDGAAVIGDERSLIVDEYSGEAFVLPRGGRAARPTRLPSWTEAEAGDVEGHAVDPVRGRVATLHLFIDEDDGDAPPRAEVRVRDHTGKRILTRAAPPFAALAFDRAGRLLVTTAGDGDEEPPSAEWWTLPDGRAERWAIEPRAAHVLGDPPQFSPDGSRMAFAMNTQVWIVTRGGVLERILGVARVWKP